MKKASSPQVGSAPDNLVVEAATFVGIDDFRPHLEMASIAVENRIPSP